MTSLLRQIVAGPRAKHQETGLDLCYVTKKIIATSGPSQTYPQRAYRNPLDRLVAYLDSKHGDGWAIWEFRAEGTGYPDEAVYGRIRHFPWPDHHPPPFALVPLIVGGMRRWLDGEDLEGEKKKKSSDGDPPEGERQEQEQIELQGQQEQEQGQGQGQDLLKEEEEGSQGQEVKDGRAAAREEKEQDVKERKEVDGGGQEGQEGKTDGKKNQYSKEKVRQAQEDIQGGGVDETNKRKGKEHNNSTDKKSNNRVVVVHCKAGKGRSGTMACSYLIAECGWTAEDALARFTDRRMRPGFGGGVSIPSQLRWVSYADRWTKGGKKYVDRAVEIVEIHVEGLRNGVKLNVEGFAEEGKKIKVFHTFSKEERIIVEGGAPGGGGVVDFVQDIAGYATRVEDDKGEVVEEGDYEAIKEGPAGRPKVKDEEENGKAPSRSSSLSRKFKDNKDKVVRKLSTRRSASPANMDKLDKNGKKSNTIAIPEVTQEPESIADTLPGKEETRSQSTTSLQSTGITFASPSEPGGKAVIFKPKEPIRIPNSDINIAVERRNRAPGNIGLTMVTAVGHVWFNTFFEGNGPEQDGNADDSGVFDIEWDKMDGIKGSSQRGTRACDRLRVVWRVADAPSSEEEINKSGVVINEPSDGVPVPQMTPANWKGDNTEDPNAERDLGLKVEDPDSASVSKEINTEKQDAETGTLDDEVALAGVKVSGPDGEEVLDDAPIKNPSSSKLDSTAIPGDEQADKTAKKGFIVE